MVTPLFFGSPREPTPQREFAPWGETQVGYTRYNRKPCILYVHNSLLKGFEANGFDGTRAKAGVVIDMRSAQKRKELVEEP